MKSILYALAICFALVASTTAQPPPSPPGILPEVDTSDVLRRGDSVQRVDGENWSGEGDHFDALAPPADDKGKWFISVVSQANCPACQRLKQDWRSSPALLAFAIPGDTNKTWAHYNEYMIEDASQQWRWKGLKFDGFPTILIQPPLDGTFGKSSTIVFRQTGYDSAANLADAMGKAMLQYVDRLQRDDPNAKGAFGVAPPWKPTPKEPESPSRILDPDRQRPHILIPPRDSQPIVKIPEEIKRFGTWEIIGVAIVAFMAILLWRHNDNEK